MRRTCAHPGPCLPRFGGGLVAGHFGRRPCPRPLRGWTAPCSRKPRLVFALSLPLGVVGREEVGELELDEPLAPEEVHARLARHAPPGLDILAVRPVDPRRTAQVRTLTYRLAVPPDRLPGLPEK